jgi:hypothetical protein
MAADKPDKPDQPSGGSGIFNSEGKEYPNEAWINDLDWDPEIRKSPSYKWLVEYLAKRDEKPKDDDAA